MKGCFSVCPSFFPSWLCVGADGSWLRACSEGDCPKQDLIIRQEEVHRHVVGTPLPERPRCGHASLWWKSRLYQELERPTASSLWGQAAMGLRCRMRTTKCQLLVTSLCVMVSRQVWGDLCRTKVNRCLCHSRSERGWFSHVLFLAGGGQAQPTARVIIAPWAVIAGHQHRPPPLW